MIGGETKVDGRREYPEGVESGPRNVRGGENKKVHKKR